MRDKKHSHAGDDPLYTALINVSELPGQVERTIQRRGLFQDGQPILVAVSGGLDSMVLLRVLHEFAPDTAGN